MEIICAVIISYAFGMLSGIWCEKMSWIDNSKSYDIIDNSKGEYKVLKMGFYRSFQIKTQYRNYLKPKVNGPKTKVNPKSFKY